VKLATVALIGLELALFPDAVRVWAVLGTLVAVGAFFAHVIASPSAQFLVRSVFRLPSGFTPASVAFTFDDGPDPIYTPQILDLLALHGARGTFFLVGRRALQHADVVRRIAREGHAIGSHTFAHGLGFHFRSARSIRDEIAKGADAIESVIGRRPRLFRPPHGVRTPMLRDALATLTDLVCVTWTARGLDTIGQGATRIEGRLSRHVRPGAILVLHDGAGLGGTTSRASTVRALGTLLDVARQRGLRCVTLADLEASP
jgi:peptidoglycan/xylan/chitin deacetylase (PgdA/CDA1 family)